jgi:hypothetical protein
VTLAHRPLPLTLLSLAGMYQPVRNPRRDDTPTPPEDWEDLQLGPGQEDRPNAHFQGERWLPPRLDVRRAPGYEHWYVPVRQRPPERPA